jgi:predicted CoA-binding protein
MSVIKILKSFRNIAVVGVSANEDKPSYGVFRYLLASGYNVIPVNPTVQEVLGRKCYPSLSAIPEKVEIVDIFRKSEDVPPIVEEAIKIGAKAVWMQQGIVNEAAAARAEAAGLLVVMDKCMRKEHMHMIEDGQQL